MTGSKTQNEFDLLNKMEEPFYERLSMLREQAIISMIASKTQRMVLLNYYLRKKEKK